MKIHIVQKGDTLWKLAKKYGVSFDELKKLNSQLSNPDLLMPGMKLKIPDSSAKKENVHPSIKTGIKEGSCTTTGIRTERTIDSKRVPNNERTTNHYGKADCKGKANRQRKANRS